MIWLPPVAGGLGSEATAAARGAVEEVFGVAAATRGADRVGGAPRGPVQRATDDVLHAGGAAESDEAAKRAFAVGGGGADQHTRGRRPGGASGQT